MRQMFSLCIGAASVLLVAGCDGDSVKDKSVNERMTRESLCVVASERFALYKEAERHIKHGLEAAKDGFEQTGKEFQFLPRLNTSRAILVGEPNDFVARFLADKCDTYPTVGQVQDF